MIIRGVVQSGGTPNPNPEIDSIFPLSGVKVTLLAATQSGPQFLGEATTDLDGAFAIDSPLTTVYSLFYLTAEVRPGLMLAAIAGGTLPETITINELTTIAAMYAGAQFFFNGAIGGQNAPLQVVAGMNANLVAAGHGVASPVLIAAPNAYQTNALKTLYSLANLLTASVRGSAAQLDALFRLTTRPGHPAPEDTLTAINNIARDPANNASALFTESRLQDVYQPALPLDQEPAAWTLAVKFNATGNASQMFGGPANVAFDPSGRAWIPNNVVQGEPFSASWSIVLEPDGKPAPFSPISGGGLYGAGFGVSLDRQGRVWIGNFGWGGEKYWPDGSVSVFNQDGSVAVANGHANGLERVQAVVVDRHDNVWMASYGNHRVVVYPFGDASRAAWYPPDPAPTWFSPFGIAIAADGTAWVTNTDPAYSTLTHYRFSGGQLTQLGETIHVGRALKGIVIDSSGTMWLGSGGDSYVYAFSSTGEQLGQFDGGGMSGPWGLALDGDENVWVGNFGPLLAKDETTNDFHGRLTKLAGSKTAGKNPGDPLSPESGFTLLTGGDEVLLSDGTPLYGNQGPPCFIPMTRTTGLNIDQAGNVWVTNNWKPDFEEDHENGNPGGDGMVIFIGLATPVPL